MKKRPERTDTRRSRRRLEALLAPPPSRRGAAASPPDALARETNRSRLVTVNARPRRRAVACREALLALPPARGAFLRAEAKLVAARAAKPLDVRVAEQDRAYAALEDAERLHEASGTMYCLYTPTQWVASCFI